MSLSFRGKKVLFVGDSHTAQYGTGWQSILAKRYGFTEKNISLVGKTTGWMLNALNLTLSQGDNYYACFIYGGTNDAYGGISNEQAVKNIQTMVDTCNKSKIIPIVVVGYNTRKVSVGNKAQQGKWDLAEKRYQQQILMQNSIKNAIVVPMWNNVNHATAAQDGLHIYGQNQIDFANYIDSVVFKK